MIELGEKEIYGLAGKLTCRQQDSEQRGIAIIDSIQPLSTPSWTIDSKPIVDGRQQS
jgi:hypothetical protein